MNENLQLAMQRLKDAQTEVNNAEVELLSAVVQIEEVKGEIPETCPAGGSPDLSARRILSPDLEVKVVCENRRKPEGVIGLEVCENPTPCDNCKVHEMRLKLQESGAVEVKSRNKRDLTF